MSAQFTACARLPHTFAFAAFVLLAACAHAPPRAASAGALAPVSALTPRSATQVIHAIYGTRAATLRTALEVTAHALTVVGVTATGQRLFTAKWDGTKIEADKSPFVPERLDPERVLADVELALWPLAAVRDVFAARGFEVTEPFAGVRRLTRQGALVAEVHYASSDPWNGRLWFANFEFDYSLTIDTTTAPSN